MQHTASAPVIVPKLALRPFSDIWPKFWFFFWLVFISEHLLKVCITTRWRHNQQNPKTNVKILISETRWWKWSSSKSFISILRLYSFPFFLVFLHLFPFSRLSTFLPHLFLFLSSFLTLSPLIPLTPSYLFVLSTFFIFISRSPSLPLLCCLSIFSCLFIHWFSSCSLSSSYWETLGSDSCPGLIRARVCEATPLGLNAYDAMWFISTVFHFYLIFLSFCSLFRQTCIRPSKSNNNINRISKWNEYLTFK